jgi:hypothetical protein
MFAVYLPPDMVSIDLSGIFPSKKGHRIDFRGTSTHKVESVTPNARVIMRIMVRRANLKFNEGWGGEWYFSYSQIVIFGLLNIKLLFQSVCRLF